MSGPTITPLHYTEDLITNYQALSDLPGFVLLESSDKIRGRYDIVTALPYDSFTVLRHSSCLHDALSQLEEMIPSAPSIGDLPFQGGAIGYFSYDFGAALAGINAVPHLYNDMPLVDIRFYDWAIVTDHHLKQVHLVVANRQPDTAAQIEEVRRLWEQKLGVHQPFILEQPFTPLINQHDYQQAFKAIHKDIVRGRAYQVNYTQPFIGGYSGKIWEMYRRIRLSNPVPYSAFLRCTAGDILSFSPEHFLSMEKGLVRTSPIKGTAKRSTNPIVDKQFKASLLGSEKNHAENVMIVDLLRNDLGKIATPGSVRVTSLCEVQSFNAVHHLVSQIEAQCRKTMTPLRVLSACFPGGSITGAPKREAMRIISEHESFARGVYCGSIAYISAHGRFDSNIAIRTITAKQGTLYLSAGGGIVLDSSWEDEYRECFTKITAIVNEFEPV